MNITAHIESFNIVTAFSVFFAYVLIDTLYAYYTIVVTKQRPLAAANAASLMYFLLAFGVLNYVENYLYVIPLALGSWIGTYMTVRYDLKKGI